MNDELERIWNEAIVEYFEFLSQQFSALAEKDFEKLVIRTGLSDWSVDTHHTATFGDK